MGEQDCLNCGERLRKEYFLGNQLKPASEKRGYFKIVISCPECHARMALVIFNRQLDRKEGFGTAVAYAHTINDEPCYDKSCKLCYGKLAEE